MLRYTGNLSGKKILRYNFEEGIAEMTPYIKELNGH
jgi:purine-nucleoside phosphorylase